MTFVNQRLTFFSDDGIYEDDSLVPTELSIGIRNKMRQLNPGTLATNPPKQYAANNKYYKQTFWSVRRAASRRSKSLSTRVESFFTSHA